MAQGLRVAADLPENPDLASSPTGQLTVVCNYSPRGSKALFWTPRTLQTCGTQTHHAGKTPIQTKEK